MTAVSPVHQDFPATGWPLRSGPRRLEGGRSAATDAVFAALGALVGYRARMTAVEATGLPDPVVAVVEDAAALVLLAAAVPDP